MYETHCQIYRIGSNWKLLDSVDYRPINWKYERMVRTGGLGEDHKEMKMTERQGKEKLSGRGKDLKLRQRSATKTMWQKVTTTTIWPRKGDKKMPREPATRNVNKEMATVNCNRKRWGEVAIRNCWLRKIGEKWWWEVVTRSGVTKWRWKMSIGNLTWSGDQEILTRIGI